MNIYLLKPQDGLPRGDDPWTPWYDKAFGFVVRAETPHDARLVAGEQAGDERHEGDVNPWLSERYSRCELLASDVSGDQEMLLMDYARA